MNLVDQEVIVWGECPADLLQAKLWIEKAGRTCYNSEMAQTPDPDKFLNKVMSNDPPHSSMFEHSNLVVVKPAEYKNCCELISKYRSRWVNVEVSNNNELYLYGNYRAFMEVCNVKSIDDVLMILWGDGFSPANAIIPNRRMRRVTVELHTDRNVLAEITRHRNDVAFSVRSQRYVDELKHMEFVKPSWFDELDFIQQETFCLSCEQSELNYRTLRKSLPPQHSRVVLNGQVKTVIVMSAYLPQWDWIFKLRRSTGAYPQMIKLMNMVYVQFVERGYAGNN